MTQDTNASPDDDGQEPEDALEKAVDRIGDAFSNVAKGGLFKKATPVDVFFRAIKSNRLPDVKRMLADGFDPNTYNAAGDTPLHVAAREGRAEIAAVLIGAGADPKRGRTDNANILPLEEAVRFGKAEVAGLLARHGGYGDKVSEGVNGWTPMHLACEKGKPLLVQALVDAGADINGKTTSGATPLLVALARRQFAVAELLLAAPGIAETIAEQHVATDEKQRTALHLAVEGRQIGIINSLIRHGCFINAADADGMTPLMTAVGDCDAELVQLLIDAGADVNVATPAGSPLLIACHIDDMTDVAAREKIIATLIRHGADPDALHPQFGTAPLHVATRMDHTGFILRALLAYPVNRDLVDGKGATPLFHAVDKPTDAALRILTESGAEVNARHKADASTPLIAAVRKKAAADTEILLQAGANPSLRDALGRSALSYARELGEEKIIQLLEMALHRRMTALRVSSPAKPRRAP